MSKWIRMSIMGALLALAFGGVPSVNAAAAFCRTPGICNQSCVACLSSQACPDYPHEVCLCGQRFCP